MNYGDFPLGETIHMLFTTRAFATGIPGTLSAATVAIYEDITATPIQTGVAVTESLNSIAGLNAVPIVGTSGNGYELGKNYHVVIEAGTVDSVSVVGEVIGYFSIGRSAAAVDLAQATDGLGAIKADTAATLVDTAVIGALGAGLTDLGGMSTGMKAEVNAEADTAVADYDGPTNAEMVTRTLTAARITQLGQNLDNCFTGTASGTPTTTTMVSGIGVTVDDQFNGRIITFDDDTTTAAIRGQSTDITGCTAASNTLTFTALTTAPVSGDTFVIT